MLLTIRDKLSYPVGIAPGFDPTHIASKGIRFSGISNGSNFVSLLQACKPGTLNGTPGKAIFGSIGPVTKYNSAGASDTSLFSGFITASEAQISFGAIIIPSSTASLEGIISTGSGANGLAFIKDVGGTLRLVRVAGADDTSTLAMSVNVPYFAALSSDNATTTNFYLRRLDIGTTLIQAVTSAVGTDTSDGTYSVGNFNTNTVSFSGYIAAVMANNKYMSMQQLIQWGDDPWAFWYPDANVNTLNLPFLLKKKKKK